MRTTRANGWAAFAILFVAFRGAGRAQTSNYELVHAFGSVGQPLANLIQAADGEL